MGCSRREFVQRSIGCAGYLAFGLSLAPRSIRQAFARESRGGKIVAEEKFGRLEEISDGVWGLISTPFGEGGPFTETVCNGGIIGGKEGVLVIEAFFTEEGARWISEQSVRLTGKKPTHVAVTHHHADHSQGLGGFSSSEDEEGSLQTHATGKMRQLIKRSATRRRPTLPEATIEQGRGKRIDLGGKVVNLVPRQGHTPSDVTVELEDPHVIWGGDLLWNGMFPNYLDAIPSKLSSQVQEILKESDALFVPGHGDAGKADRFAPYRGLLEEVESAARRAFEKGVSFREAADEFKLPKSLESWTVFAPDLFARAFSAWERELKAEGND